MGSKKIMEISSVDKLEYIRQTVCKITEDKISAVIYDVTKEKDINTLMNVFSKLNNTFAEEEERLLEDSENHNKRYANVDNDKYSTAYNVLYNIKDCVFSFLKIIRIFSKQKQHAFYGNRCETKSIEFRIKHSLVGELETSGCLFDNLTPRQKRLVEEMENFFDYLDRNLQICIKIVCEEDDIRADMTKSRRLFEDQLEEVYEIVKGKKGGSQDKAFFKELMDIDRKPENVQKWFHKITPNQMGDVALGLKGQRLSEFTPSQRAVFDDNPQTIRFFIDVVSHLDECVNKISGETLAYVMKYTDCDCPSQTAFYDCFCETYQQVGGKNHVVSKQRFNQAYSEMIRGKFTAYDSFVTKIEMYLL